MNTVTVAIAAFGITLGLGTLAQVSADYQEYEYSVCASSPEIAGPDCGNPGDDNGDGWIEEDESGWDCRTMGNRICGEVTER